MGDSHERRVLKRAADPIAKRVAELQVLADGSWKRLTDHPKLCLAVALIAIAITFSGKVSAMAMWICLAIAWPLLTAWLAGLSSLKQARYRTLWVGLCALVFAGGLLWLGHFLKPGIPPQSELLNAIRGIPDAVLNRIAPLIKQRLQRPTMPKEEIGTVGPAPRPPTHSDSVLPVRQLNLIFKDSLLFTPARRDQIQTQLDRFYAYLTGVGFELPQDIPPIGTRPGKAISMSYGSTGRVYDADLRIPEQSIDDQDVFRLSVKWRTGVLR